VIDIGKENRFSITREGVKQALSERNRAYLGAYYDISLLSPPLLTFIPDGLVLGRARSSIFEA